MVKLKIVYFGTPDFSAELLRKLVEDKNLPIEIIGVVTQPDKKVGRKQILTPSPVKKVAGEYKLALNPDLKSADLALLFAYGEILPSEMLTLPRYGFWNVHPSLLPLYRGSSPVATPLLNGDIETGVTIIKMDNLLDHGPIISQKKSYIFPLQRRDQLTERLVETSFEMLGELFGKYAGNMDAVELREQDHSKATFTKKLTKQDGNIDIRNLKLEIRNSSKKLFNLFRGLYPWPGIWTLLPDKKRLKITKIHWEDEKIVIKKIQLEGKNEMDYVTFCRAYPNVL
ncbi:hypothetical protein KBC14_02280 [Candidatus Woesebacteria bacterium]|jgi:methionyl-tRNA formyltransferase|nr:hypothetical protein [Candidatus Woesebacteria bacterium]MBP6883196.1 hypothetical protein [Candidatus Woesebacteria bacterium]